MLLRTSLLWCLLTSAAAAEDPGKLFEQAEQLARSHQLAEAMAKVEQAVAEIDRAHAAGEDISWQGTNGLRFAARLAREDFLDYEKSFYFCNRLFELADTDYWKVPARLERALTYRAMGQFDKAQQEYDAIAKADERQRPSGLLPQAEMVYLEMGDRERGRALMEDALMNEAVNGRERFRALRNCAQRAMSEGRRNEALGWYQLLRKLPYQKAEERDRFLSQAWYEMGKIEESRGRTTQAKEFYRQAMQLEDGDMRFRARARDSLESIEYFE
jgi:tetratricopeptide (TPR) repeat protein